MIERAVLPNILEDVKYFPVLGIIGPRQVGKTTLAQSLRALLDKETLYFPRRTFSAFRCGMQALAGKPG